MFLIKKKLLYRNGIPFWRDSKSLSFLAQLLSTLIVISLLGFLVTNLINAANARGFSLGFGFINQEAGFPISESVINYEPSNSFLKAFSVGILNTLRVAILGIILSTILGTFLGICRVSSNWLLRQISVIYVEIFRNIPLLVQLFFWYFIVFQALPRVQTAIELPGPIYLSNRGIFLPFIEFDSLSILWLIPLTTIPLLLILKHKRLHHYLFFILFIALAYSISFLQFGIPVSIDTPVLGKFNFAGGIRITPEFGALLVGLTVYTSSFIAEIVRAGIQSVPRGQTESAYSLGLSKNETLRLVIIPQALKVIIPPLINQYLNLSKNSSLAIAIGFPDTFFVGRTMINQAGRAVPIFGMIMLAYGLMSLIWSIIGNFFDHKLNKGKV